MTIGTHLKSVREEKGYTLKQIAELSGLSIGFISQVERGQTDPSLSSLKKMASALGIRLGDLFDRDDETHVRVQKGGGRVIHVSPSVSCELLATSFNKVMEPMIKIIGPGGESGLVDPHVGEEFIWVIEGQLQVMLGDDTYSLSSGDSVYYRANITHAWKNNGPDVCRALWVMTPPSYS